MSFSVYDTRPCAQNSQEMKASSQSVNLQSHIYHVISKFHPLNRPNVDRSQI